MADGKSQNTIPIERIISEDEKGITVIEWVDKSWGPFGIFNDPIVHSPKVYIPKDSIKYIKDNVIYLNENKK